MLKELKINGSKFPTLKLAEGGIINTLYLNPLESLNVKDLQLLTNFRYDDEIFNTLRTVCIQNCPALNDFSYALVKNNAITNYCFNDIDWNIPSEDFDVATGEIDVLENLLAEDENGNKLKKPTEVSTQSLALTGKATINLSEDIEDGKVKEYDIYENYKKEFPNLNIAYDGNLKALTSAFKITFYNG
jgi:hypothetical protein